MNTTRYFLGCSAACLLLPASGAHAQTDYETAVQALSPVAYWRFEETSGTNAADEQSLANGVYSGSVTLAESGFDGVGNAARFSGNDWVEVAHENEFMLDEGTISLWFNADNGSSRGELFSKDSSNYDDGGHITMWVQSNRLTLRIQSKTASYTLQSSSGSIVNGAWHHTMVSFGPSGVVLYLDGVAVDTDSYTGGLGNTSGGSGNTEPIAIGAGTWTSGNGTVQSLSYYFRGVIDEVAIFGTEFDADDALSLYGSGGQIFVDVSTLRSFNIDTNGGLHYGSGLGWADLDNDGDLDSVLSGNSSKVMWNSIADGTFSATSTGSLDRQLAILDIDRDGDFDVAACAQSPVSVLENQGGSMVSVGSLGFGSVSNAEGAVAADVDADGDTDLLVFSQNGNWIGVNMGADFEGYSPIGFDHDNDPADGLNDPGDYGNGDYVSAADVNNDGYLDFFYHYSTGKLFLSNADGTFTENSSGISTYTNNSYKFGSAWGDYDNDGDMDLFTPDARSGQTGELWQNNGGVFSNVATAAGITANSSMRSSCWGDYDNDGDLDLYIATASSTVNLLYTNDGDGTFTLDHLGAGLAGGHEDACFVDFDNDGDLDLSLTTRDGDGKTRLLENQTNDANYLLVRTLGPDSGASNPGVIGTRVELFDASGGTLLARREVGVARGYGGSEPIWAHFGGVDPALTYIVRITWPGGAQATSSVVPGNVSTTIGAQTVPQMFTIEQVGGARVVNWRAVSPID